MTTTATLAPTRARRLTGFKPTGHLHLGNLLGALRPLIHSGLQRFSAAGELGAQGAGDSIALIADLHAMTVDHEPHRVRELALEQATVLLAAGVDPRCTPIVLQSHVTQHTELHYLLECVAGSGEASRMIQFKEKSASGPVRLSLLTYPVLMAADILLYDAGQVPVGEDQNQHLELTRTLATRFNARYRPTFTVPQACAGCSRRARTGYARSRRRRWAGHAPPWACWTDTGRPAPPQTRAGSRFSKQRLRGLPAYWPKAGICRYPDDW